MAKSRLKKVILITIGAIVLLVVLVIVFISPIAKYIIEKYDEKWTGRQITIGSSYVNPFTGYCRFSDVKFYEEKKDTSFLTVEVLSGKFEMRKMLVGTYEISQLVLDRPWGNIVQLNKKGFNFTSLIDHMAGPDSVEEKKDTLEEPSHFNILNIKIKDGEFHYLQKEIPVTYFIKKVNIESDGKLWNADTVMFRFFFESGPGTGSIQGHYTVNFKSLDFHYAITVHHFDLTQIEQYLKPVTNYGTFRAILDAGMMATGNFKDAEDVTAHGMLAISDFHFGKTRNEDYASFERLVLAIEELSPKNKKYIFDSVSLTRPILKYEQYDYLDNFQTMFGTQSGNLKAAAEGPERFNLVLEIARYTKILSRNFFSSYYRINKLAIRDADLKYNDYSLSEKFATAISPLTIVADSIDKNNERLKIAFNAGIKPYGSLSVALSINPRDTGDFDMTYRFHRLPVTMFNPYIITYTSFPLDRGVLELNGNWAVRKGEIKSDNHLVILDPRVSKRVKNKNTKWLPLPLIMSLVRENANVIDYQIPITGNLKYPNFHLKDVIFDALKNIFVKPPMTPYRMEVRDIEGDIEQAIHLKWNMRQSNMRSDQEKVVEEIAEFLEENPEATISVIPRQYAVKEKEHILFFEAKKKYYMALNKKDAQSFSEKDSEQVAKMSVKDSLFIRYLDRHIKDSLLFSIQDKCSRFIDAATVNKKFKQLGDEREKAFLSYFEKEGVANKVKMMPAENTIPFNGFSFYKIEYKGELPKSLVKAYEKLQDLNDEGPRKKYEKQRWKIRL